MKPLKKILLILFLFISEASLGGGPTNDPILTVENGIHRGSIWSIDIDRNERYVVTGGGNTARVWDFKTGNPLKTLRVPSAKDDSNSLRHVTISPDGRFVAVSGMVGYRWSKKINIYILDWKKNQVIRRISNLTQQVTSLKYSPDGQKLAVGFVNQGVALYSTRNGSLIAKDGRGLKGFSSISFSRNGNMVGTCFSYRLECGSIRLYTPQLKLIKELTSLEGVSLKEKLPVSADFSPDGNFLSVAFFGMDPAAVLSGRDLSLKGFTKHNIKNNKGTLELVKWSKNGAKILVAGKHTENDIGSLVSFSSANRSISGKLPTANGGTVSFVTLKDGGVILSTSSDILVRLNSAGRMVWEKIPLGIRTGQPAQRGKLAISENAKLINFDYSRLRSYRVEQSGRLAWDADSLRLSINGPARGLYYPIRELSGFPLVWNQYTPEYKGKKLYTGTDFPLSASISQDRQQFAISSYSGVRYFDSSGKQLWHTKTPDRAVSINLSRDKKWVVVGLDNGTIRWYEQKNGKERLALYIHGDLRRWVAWTPDGFYANSPEAKDLIGYHINRGAGKTADFVSINRLKKFAREDLVARALYDDYPRLAQNTLKQAGKIQSVLRSGRLPPKLSIAGGKKQFNVQGGNFSLPIEVSNRGSGIGRIEYRIAGKVFGDPEIRSAAAFTQGGVYRKKRPFTLPPGRTIMQVVAFSKDGKLESDPVEAVINVTDPVRKRPSLHILSIGVTDYDDDSLDLKFAADDAFAFAETLEKHTGLAVYKKVNKIVLLDEDANLNRIRVELNKLAKNVKPQDVFVLYLAGHGMALDGQYYYIPQNLRFSGNQAVRQQALSADKLRDWLQPIRAKKNLLIIDTCSAGKSIHTLAVARGGNSLEDKVAIGNLMESTGFALLAASSTQQQAFAGIVDHASGKGHGLFTNSLLNGLRGAADSSKDSRVSIRELEQYIHRQVPRLSQQKWKFKQIPMSQVIGDDFIVSLR